MISVTTTSVMHLGVNHTFSSIQLSDQTDPLRAINLGAGASVPSLAGRHSDSAIGNSDPASVPVTVSDRQTGGMEPVAGVAAAGRNGQRGRYGIDGGYAGLAVFGVMEAGLAATVAWAARRRRPGVAALAAVGGAAVAGSAASYLYSTGPGKRAIWAQLLDELGLRGDEHVLDVGCGRGAVLMLAAGRVPAGRAVGADVWRRRDQSGNGRAAAERNAVAEGVRDRVELVDADARDLPFASASFDVVVSSLAISNIREAGGRARALREAVRVLRPGGRLRIVDDGARRYAAVLREAGCTGVSVRQLDWRTWYGLPGHHIPLVAAARPPG